MDREDEVRKISIISALCWMDLVSHFTHETASND